jgi:potassium-transporting ATPase KdpC subunit
MKTIIRSVRQTLVWAVITGIIYPVAMTVFAQVFFHHQANGSLVRRDGEIIGSAMLAQPFTGNKYFWPRPSACSYGTGPSGIVFSSGSNLGPTSAALRTNVLSNIAAFISGNNLPTNTVVPADMVYASASGLDPDVSPESVQLQAARVAAARDLSLETIKALVDKFTQPPQWGIFGQARVNVLMLNVALDQLSAQKSTARTTARDTAKNG